MNVSSNLKITKSLVSNITRSYSISKSSVKNQNNFIYSSKRFVNQNSWASARLKEIGEKVEFAEPLPLVLVTEEVLFNPPPKILNLVEMCVSFNQYEVKEMTERLGARLQLPVHPSAPNFGAPLPIGTASSSSEADIEAAKPKEKEAYTIKIGAVDQKVKIKVIKEVRVITGLGLKEAKELVEKAPVVLKDGVKKEEAENIKKILLEAGATVELV